jgi:oxaloacetate decarboxylase gamma subunit
MTQDLNTALLLLLVGMSTVFFVLGIVVLTGRLLIKITNRTGQTAGNVVADIPVIQRDATMTPTPGRIAAITAAISTITNGTGRIEKIQRIKE